MDGTDSTGEKVPETPIKKPRKPRTPKVKPPKKERVVLGGIILGTKVTSTGIFKPLDIQPPADIANDVVKVERWAATQEGLARIDSSIFMYRQYNALLSVKASTKLEAAIEFIKEEVPQSNETV